MKVVDNIFSEGERRSLLVNKDGQIDFWSTLYVTVMLRQDQKKHRLRENYIILNFSGNGSFSTIEFYLKNLVNKNS